MHIIIIYKIYSAKHFNWIIIFLLKIIQKIPNSSWFSIMFPCIPNPGMPEIYPITKCTRVGIHEDSELENTVVIVHVGMWKSIESLDLMQNDVDQNAQCSYRSISAQRSAYVSSKMDLNDSNNGNNLWRDLNLHHSRGVHSHRSNRLNIIW